MLRTVLGSTSHKRAVERTELPSRRHRRTISALSSRRRESGPSIRSPGSVKRLPHCWHLWRCEPSFARPALTVSIRQEWQVMESPIEFHSPKPDNGVEDSCGFGCANRSPGRCFSTDRGFLFHALIILDPLIYVRLDFHMGVKYNSGMAHRL